MTPVERKELVDALQSVIDKIKTMDDDQRIGLLLSCGIQKEKDGDKFETTNILIGHQYIITHNLTREITEDTDYTRLFAGILHNLD
jgi:hypothetical protein